MSNKAKPEICEYILSNVKAHPSDIVRKTANHFHLSVQGIQKHIAKMLAQGKLRKSGNTRAVIYHLPSTQHSSVATAASRNVVSRTWNYSVDEKLNEQDFWDETLKKRLKEAPENIREIAEYGFTEMVNNVIDHSLANKLKVSYDISNDNILQIQIQDNGVGIFRKIKESLGLDTLREAVLHLSKGKFTTDHTRHTGEGIFFSSRVFDRYFLAANGLMYGHIYISEGEDWLLGEETTALSGTLVQMFIDLKSKRTRQEIFEKFTSAEDFSFSKTQVAVELGMLPGETYVSRSQAKRILAGLNKFRFIVLNFKRVSGVGQGFADEVFRVFRNAHPEIKIEYINANESVEFMIKRILV